MKIELSCFIALAATFLFSMLIAPLVIKTMKKLKAGQVILGYVFQHSAKEGTPTMGGFIFIIPVAVVTLAVGYGKLSLVAVLLMLGYSLVGFLDDFLKIKTHNNLGLKPYQKIIGQTGLAAIAAVFVYKNPVIGSAVGFPFTAATVDFSWGIIPFTMLVYIAATNAVNLTDGLDGLASTTSLIYFIGYSLIATTEVLGLIYYGQDLTATEVKGVAVFSASLVGGLMAFLWFNFNPAKIMMGDTGSLALGSAVATVAVFLKNPFSILISGIMFVVSCISVIVQVTYFKLTKKRVFLMAPYHHHLEKKGIPEWNIVCRYAVITTLFTALNVLSKVVYEL